MHEKLQNSSRADRDFGGNSIKFLLVLQLCAPNAAQNRRGDETEQSFVIGFQMDSPKPRGIKILI